MQFLICINVFGGNGEYSGKNGFSDKRTGSYPGVSPIAIRIGGFENRDLKEEQERVAMIARLVLVLLSLAASFGGFLIEGGHAEPAAVNPKPSSSHIPVQPNIAKLQVEGHVFKAGEPCQRMSGGRGIIKRDACGRWYCSRLNYQDITERRPNFAAEVGCTWRLVGVHCQCLPPGRPPTAK